MLYRELFEEVLKKTLRKIDIVYKSDISFSKTEWVQEDDEGETIGTFQIIGKENDLYFASEYKCTFYVMHPKPGKGAADFPDLKDIEQTHFEIYKSFDEAKKNMPKFKNKGSVKPKDVENLDTIQSELEDIAKEYFEENTGSEVEFNI